MSDITSPSDEFAPAWVETLPDGTEVRFVPFDLDHYAETCQGLNAAREASELQKVDGNPKLSEYERAQLMQSVRKDKLPITYAMWYRRQDPVGIRVGLRRAIVAGFAPAGTPDEKKTLDAQADALLKRIKPSRKMIIVDYLVDPYPLTKPKKDEPAGPKPEPVSTTETGSETDGSSSTSSPESGSEV